MLSYIVKVLKMGDLKESDLKLGYYLVTFVYNVK